MEKTETLSIVIKFPDLNHISRIIIIIIIIIIITHLVTLHKSLQKTYYNYDRTILNTP